MTRVLVLYDTTDGHTRQVADDQWSPCPGRRGAGIGRRGEL